MCDARIARPGRNTRSKPDRLRDSCALPVGGGIGLPRHRTPVRHNLLDRICRVGGDGPCVFFFVFDTDGSMSERKENTTKFNMAF